MKQSKSCGSNGIQTHSHLVHKLTHKNSSKTETNFSKFAWLHNFFEIISLFIWKYYKVKRRDNVPNSKFY